MAERERHAVLTGATRGIGRSVLRTLTERGWRVTAVVRDGSELAGAEVLRCDLREPDPIRRVAAALTAGPRIDALVHVAGTFESRPAHTAAGVEVQYAVNYLAPWRLTEALRPVLGPARIVFVASHAWRKGSPTDRGQSTGLAAYRGSKRALVLYGHHLAGAGFDVHSVHPGVARTGIADRSHGLVRVAWGLMQALASTPDRAADPITRLVCGEAPPVPSGTYWYGSRPLVGALDRFAEESAARQADTLRRFA